MTQQTLPSVSLSPDMTCAEAYATALSQKDRFRLEGIPLYPYTEERKRWEALKALCLLIRQQDPLKQIREIQDQIPHEFLVQSAASSDVCMEMYA